MSSFKQGALVLSHKTTPVVSDNNSDTTLVSRGGKIYTYYQGLEQEVGTGVGGGSSLSVTDGTTTVTNVSSIDFDGASITNSGNGSITIAISGGSTGGGSSYQSAVTSVTGNSFTPNDSSNAYSYTLNNNATIYCPTNLLNGESKTIRFVQPSGTNYALSFQDSPPFTWKFPNANPPTLTSSPNAIDIMTIIRIDNDVYVTIMKNFAPFNP